MGQFIVEVFEVSLREIEQAFPGYLTLIDCLKIFYFHYPDFKYVDVGKFGFNPTVSHIIAAKLRSIPDLELFLQKAIKNLFCFQQNNSISAEFILQIDPRMQLIIVLTLFIKALNESGTLSRRFISSSLATFKLTSRLYEVILSSYYLADDGFFLAYSHFASCLSARKGLEGTLFGLLGFFFWLCFESFSPAVYEFLRINLGRVDEILALRFDLLSSFGPFVTLLKMVLSLTCRADQIAMDHFRSFSVSQCEGHPLMDIIHSFLSINSTVSCKELAIMIVKRFGSPELADSYPRDLSVANASASMNYSVLSDFLQNEMSTMATEDLNYVLENCRWDEGDNVFKSMLLEVYSTMPDRLSPKVLAFVYKLLESDRHCAISTE